MKGVINDFIQAVSSAGVIQEYKRFLKYGEDSPMEIGDFTITTIENNGGEGKGEHADCVFKLERNKGEVGHFRVVGYYASYEGKSFEDPFDLEHVVEKEVTQKQWVKVK